MPEITGMACLAKRFIFKRSKRLHLASSNIQLQAAAFPIQSLVEFAACYVCVS